MNELENFLRRLAEQAPKDPRPDDDDEIIEAEIVADPTPAPRRALRSEPEGGLTDAPFGNAAIGDADERLESHLHDVFEHKVGDLDEADAATAAQPVAQRHGPQVAKLLRSPHTLRDLIILGEIIQRPEHRW